MTAFSAYDCIRSCKWDSPNLPQAIGKNRECGYLNDERCRTPRVTKQNLELLRGLLRVVACNTRVIVRAKLNVDLTLKELFEHIVHYLSDSICFRNRRAAAVPQPRRTQACYLIEIQKRDWCSYCETQYQHSRTQWHWYATNAGYTFTWPVFLFPMGRFFMDSNL